LILQKECGKDELIVADSAEPRLIDEIWDEGFNVKGAIKGPDSIVTGIRLLQNYKLIVDPDSHNLKEELNNYQWNDRRSGKPVDAYNHICDSIRYYSSYVATQNEFFVI